MNSVKAGMTRAFGAILLIPSSVNPRFSRCCAKKSESYLEATLNDLMVFFGI